VQFELEYPEHLGKHKTHTGIFLTQSLFREKYLHIKTGVEPLWCLSDSDPYWIQVKHTDEQGRHWDEDGNEVNIVPSLKRLYIECMDPTEYACAMRAFGSWKLWQKLKGTKWFCEHVDLWNIELEVAMRSKGINVIIDEVAKSGRSKYAAAKWLAEAGYKEARRGRPTKDMQQKEDLIASQLQERTEEDAARIGLIVDNVG